MRSLIVTIVGFIGLLQTSSAIPAAVPGSASSTSINSHPKSGKVPPQGAVLVSQNGEENGSFSSFSAALASLPIDNTDQTIFIFSGKSNDHHDELHGN